MFKFRTFLSCDVTGWVRSRSSGLPSAVSWLAAGACAGLFSLSLPWLSPADEQGNLKGYQSFVGQIPNGKNFPYSTVPQRKPPLFEIGNFKGRFMNLQVYETIWCFGVCRPVALTVQSLDSPLTPTSHSPLQNSSIQFLH